MSDAAGWSIEERSRNIHRIEFSLPHVGDEAWVLCQSDVHWDNPKCDRELFFRHLDEARERNAPVLGNGDFFCAMQGKWDKRANKEDLRPEHQSANYLDSLVDSAVRSLEPYKEIITVAGVGNHETAILKKHETNLMARLVERLRSAGGKAHLGGYSGWVMFNVRYAATSAKTFKLHYLHGYGGGGPVTRGVIQTNRQAVYLADADMVWTGHTHDSWIVPIARVKLTNDGNRVEHTQQVHFRTAGYKEEYGDGYGGWHVERGGPPKPVGAAWIRFRYDSRRGGISFEITEAK